MIFFFGRNNAVVTGAEGSQLGMSSRFMQIPIGALHGPEESITWFEARMVTLRYPCSPGSTVMLSALVRLRAA